MDQIFVIAQMDKTRRWLATIRSDYLRGYGITRVCLRLIQIFSDPANRITLKQELAMAAKFFYDFTKKEYFDRRPMPPRFSFITACLLIGAGYDPENPTVRNGAGVAHLRHNALYAPDTTPHDSNEITILDITDLENVAYCFLTTDKVRDRGDFAMEPSWRNPGDPEPSIEPQTCSQYLSRPIERHPTQGDDGNDDNERGEILNTFEKIPLVTVRALQGIFNPINFTVYFWLL